MVPIFQAKTSKKAQGFTLLEIMIVMGIVAGLVVLGLPRLGGQNNQIRQAVRRLSALTRELANHAKLQGAVYRLVIEMGEGKAKQHYWVEKATAKTVLSPTEMEELKEEKPKDEEEAKLQAQNALFQMDSKLIKGPTELPGELKFEDVELRRRERPVTTGKVYIHFFPQGLADEAVIHLKGSEKLRWTLAIHPLTGKATTLNEHVTLKEMSE